MNGASFTLPINKPNTAPPKPGFVEMYMSSEGVLMVRNSDDVHAPIESARELIGKPNSTQPITNPDYSSFPTY